MSDFAATNYDNNEVNYTKRWECYGGLDDASSKVIGLNRNTCCYVTSTYIYNTIGDKNFSRCGTQILLTGPSQKTVICTIVGVMDISIKAETYGLKTRYIGVDTSIYNQLTSGFKSVIPYLSQVTLVSVTNDYGINPSICLLKYTDNKATVQVINSNLIVTRMQVVCGEQTEMFYLDEDATFTIKFSSDTCQFVLFSFDDIKVSTALFSVKDFVKDKVVQTTRRFPSTQKKNYQFVIDKDIIPNRKGGEKIEFFSWQLWQFNPDSTSWMIPLDTNNIELNTRYYEEKNGRGLISFGFFYPTELVFEQNFDELHINYELEDTSLFMFGQCNLGFKNKYGKVDLSGITFIKGDLKEKHYVNKEKKTVELKVAFDPTRKYYSNFLTLSQYVKNGTFLRITSASLVRSKGYDSYEICDHTAWDCAGTQCTITDNSTYVGESPFTGGCRPLCGICRDGFSCTNTGFCLEEKNSNMRSSSSIVPILFGVLVLLSL